MTDNSPARELVKKYFEQQSELFGKDLYSKEALNSLSLRKDDTIRNYKENDEDTLKISEQKMNYDAVTALDEFYESIKDCQKCSLGKSRTKFVFGVGNPDADIIFVGEAPGRDEDLKGEPFVGRAGQLLDKMLNSIGLNRNLVYIGNILKCRPPENRDPLPTERELCEPYLIRQIELIKPKLIVALGRIAAHTLMRTDQTLKILRESELNYHGTDFKVTYHPAALLRNPNLKYPAWEDLQEIRDKYLKK
ncbi:uracil-DNA glycosylase family protein [candidate division KSB1 bacterium]